MEKQLEDQGDQESLQQDVDFGSRSRLLEGGDAHAQGIGNQDAAHQ